MVDISIVCLIYKSPNLADAFYKSLIRYTPLLHSGRAEFFFVANDPTEELLKHLKKMNYPFILNNNEIINDDELFSMGYAKPEYIRRVYRGYNAGIKHAKGDKIVLVNSDNFFSKDWLENLLKYLSYNSIICSTIVEPGHETYGVFPQAKSANFGNRIENFQNENFQTYANLIKKTGIKTNGAYMPCLMYKDVAILANLYPEGNIANNSADKVKYYGDMYFYQKLSAFGIKHYTSKDSIVYHLKEGEKDSKANDIMPKHRVITPDYKFTMKPNPRYLATDLKPTSKHYEIIQKLLLKVSIIIYKYDNLEDLENQINMMLNQTYHNKEIIVIKNTKVKIEPFIESKYNNQIMVWDFNSKDFVYRIILSIYKSEGSYIFLPSTKFKYDDNLLETMVNSLKEKGLNSVQIYKENDHTSANLMLLPKDLLIINTPNLLNYILSDKFEFLNLDNFNGDYFIEQVNKISNK